MAIDNYFESPGLPEVGYRDLYGKDPADYAEEERISLGHVLYLQRLAQEA